MHPAEKFIHCMIAMTLNQLLEGKNRVLFKGQEIVVGLQEPHPCTSLILLLLTADRLCKEALEVWQLSLETRGETETDVCTKLGPGSVIFARRRDTAAWECDLRA